MSTVFALKPAFKGAYGQVICHPKPLYVFVLASVLAFVMCASSTIQAYNTFTWDVFNEYITVVMICISSYFHLKHILCEHILRFTPVTTAHIKLCLLLAEIFCSQINTIFCIA